MHQPLSIDDHIVKALRSAYLVVDHDLRVCKVGGYQEVLDDKPMLGTQLIELFPELFGSEEDLAALFAGNLDQLWLTNVNRSDATGARRYLDLLTIPYYDSAGQITALIQLVSDATERGTREQARNQQRNELHLLKQQLTRQNVALARVNAELLRVTQLKDELLAGMSHEVRTPLTAILGFADLLKAQMMGPLNQEQLDALSMINESSHYMLALINDFLDIARYEAGRMELDPQAISVPDLCQASLRMIKELAMRKRIRTSLKVDPGVHVMRADDRRLRQALINLLSNAVKFTPSGGAIGLEVVPDLAAELVRFTVWDTGIGIAPEDSARLFHSFIQIDNAFQREHKGSGLGLVLVAQVAQLHGGGVELISELGQGSRFTIAVPWTPAEQAQLIQHLGKKLPEEPELRIEELAALALLPAQARQQPVLLIEDDAASIAVQTNFLQRYGYRVTVAHSVAETLAAVRVEPPCLILSDLRLRGMHGSEVIRQLRAHTALQEIPIIAIAVLTMPGDQQRYLEAGANVYLSKPVRLRHLAGIMAELLENSFRTARQHEQVPLSLGVRAVERDHIANDTH